MPCPCADRPPGPERDLWLAGDDAGPPGSLLDGLQRRAVHPGRRPPGACAERGALGMRGWRDCPCWQTRQGACAASILRLFEWCRSSSGALNMDTCGNASPFVPLAPLGIPCGAAVSTHQRGTIHLDHVIGAGHASMKIARYMTRTCTLVLLATIALSLPGQTTTWGPAVDGVQF